VILEALVPHTLPFDHYAPLGCFFSAFTSAFLDVRYRHRIVLALQQLARIGFVPQGLFARFILRWPTRAGVAGKWYPAAINGGSARVQKFNENIAILYNCQFPK
jgi:hypothetical protein